MITQAGLSRATLEISSEFSSYFPLRTLSPNTILWFGPLSLTFEEGPSSIESYLQLKQFLISLGSPKLKFKI